MRKLTDTMMKSTRILSLDESNGIPLSEAQVRRSVTKLLNKRISIVQFRKLLFTVIPERTLDVETTELMATYALDSHKIFPQRSKVVFQWLIGLLEYDLVDLDNLDVFYFNLLHLVSNKLLAPLICKLLYLLMRDPTDIFRWHVEKILKVHSSVTISRHTAALLTLMKSFRPDLVPENIPVGSVKRAFPALPKALRDVLDGLAMNANKNKSFNRRIIWNVRKGKKIGKNLTVPNIRYLTTFSGVYEVKRTGDKQVCQFKNLLELTTYHPSLEALNHSCALLETEAGRHLLCYSESRIQERFEYFFGHSLKYELFTSNIANANYAEMSHLFENILSLLEYSQQGIPFISKIMLLYFKKYGGFRMTKTILNILSWTVPTSMEELFVEFLLPLRNLLITSPTAEQRCDVINTVTLFIRNIIVCGVYPKLQKIENLFKCPRVAHFPHMFKEFGTWLTDFSNDAMRIEGPGVLESLLRLHETLARLQLGPYKLLWSGIAPIRVAYGCLTSLNACQLNTFCRLLLLYKELRSKHHKDIAVETALIQMYASDYIGLLWYGKKKLLKRSAGKSKTGTSPYKFQSFDLSMHFAFMPYIQSLVRNELLTSVEDGLEYCKTSFPDIAKFVITVAELESA